MKLCHSTWPQVEEYLKQKDTLILPIGSTEQHGPTGLIGTDYLTAWRIAERVADDLAIIVAPPLCYGMAQHHLGFPGTASLKPLTYIQVIRDIIQSFISHGFKTLYLINGHGGNIASVQASVMEIKSETNECHIELINWWTLDAIEEYSVKAFGNQNGYHATPSEISMTMHLDTPAFNDIEQQNFSVEPSPNHMGYGPAEFRRIFSDGRIASNPGLSTAEHGKVLFEIAVEEIKLRIRNAL